MPKWHQKLLKLSTHAVPDGVITPSELKAYLDNITNMGGSYKSQPIPEGGIRTDIYVPLADASAKPSCITLEIYGYPGMQDERHILRVGYYKRLCEISPQYYQCTQSLLSIIETLPTAGMPKNVAHALADDMANYAQTHSLYPVY
ncbi:MAG: hypothetical protein HY364_00280 [Candidatus Aenigmarchaeota archaeon]|nr:hypothetical protein [Candidatus Aenigmarchaeota archaeon]